MTRTGQAHARAKTETALPTRLTLQWLLAEMVAAGLIPPEAPGKMKLPPGKKGTADPHPLVIAASQEWPDRRQPTNRLTLEALTQWLAHRVRLPYLRIDPLSLEVGKLTELVPYAYASRVGILPVKTGPQGILFAVKDPLALEWMIELQPALKAPLKRVCANPQDIDRYLVEFYAIARSVKLSGEERAQAGPMGLQNLEQLTELSRAGKLSAEDRHVVAIVDWLLQYAFEQRASDIHLEPRREAGRMRFRIDGVMHKVFELPPPVMTAVTSRIKILARMDVAEKRRPQDGRIKTRSSSGREVELRISSMPTAFGEKLVMRIFDPDIVAKDFSQLGFSPSEGTLWRSMVERPHGIVLVTGPTGSGKTTTLYSTLKHLATPDINVCTVEDPIEMVSPELNQMQVQSSIDLDFAAGVRTLLRQDPDIIMVGEIRDLETAQMAVQASLTGHLVLSTLHTNDAPSAVTRLLDLGVPHYLIQSTLTGVVAQRLVRTLCPHCKIEAQQEPHEWTVLTHGWSIPVPERVFKPVGCLECRNTGFLGRTGIYEMMELTPRLRGMVGAELDLIRFGQAALADGMRPLRISASDQVARGLTTVQEVLAVLPPVEHIEDSPL